MSPLPDRKRPNLVPPGRTLAKSLARMALATAWRSLHPQSRGHFIEVDAPAPVARVHYRTTDGWRAPLFRVDPAPGGSGEPVLLLHGVALGPQSLRYGGGPTLASTLARAGFTVYCVSHRGDRDAEGHQDVHLDAVLERDLPSALDAALADSSFRRAHVVGHGLGGQLALALSSRADLASVTAIAAPVRFGRSRSETLAFHRALAQLPTHWNLPTASLARIGAPWLDAHSTMGSRLHPGSTEPARIRGVLHHASGDVALGILHQLRQWVAADSLTDRGGHLDYVEAMVDARAPLHLVHAPGDALGSDASPIAIESRWHGTVDRTDVPATMARLDTLLGRDAPDEVFTPVVNWLHERRKEAW